MSRTSETPQLSEQLLKRARELEDIGDEARASVYFRDASLMRQAAAALRESPQTPAERICQIRRDAAENITVRPAQAHADMIELCDALELERTISREWREAAEHAQSESSASPAPPQGQAPPRCEALFRAGGQPAVCQLPLAHAGDHALLRPAEPVAPAPKSTKDLYDELLYTVASKYPNETRHQTALRYIRSCESRSSEACAPSSTSASAQEDR